MDEKLVISKRAHIWIYGSVVITERRGKLKKKEVLKGILKLPFIFWMTGIEVWRCFGLTLCWISDGPPCVSTKETCSRGSFVGRVERARFCFHFACVLALDILP